MSLLFRILFIALMMVAMISARAEDNPVIEMEVQGMTCPFCVYGLKKQLEKLPDVKQADVSLKNNKVRLTLEPDTTPDETLYRETILDAGFTSEGVTHYGREEHR